MAKNKSSYQCESCGVRLGKWAGQCPECREWNCIIETVADAGPGGRIGGYSGQLSNEVKKLSSIGQSNVDRMAIGVGELDRVLGGPTVFPVSTSRVKSRWSNSECAPVAWNCPWRAFAA